MALSPRRSSARSLQLPRALPVLDRRGSRFRHLRHDRRLAFRQGDDRRRRRLGPDDRADRARARQHPAGQLESGRLSRRARHAGAGAGDPQRLHGQAGRPGRRTGQARRRSRVGGARCRSRSRCRAARARSSWATPATPSSSRTRMRRAPRRRWPTRCSRRCRARRCSSARRRVTARRTPKLGIDLDIKGHNALQSTFVFDA